MSSGIKINTLILAISLTLVAQTIGAQELEIQPKFQIVQSHFLEYPLLKKDFDSWKTLGAAVIHKSKVVLVPEARDRRGIFYHTQPNPLMDSWLADIELHLGNQQQTTRGGAGVAIFYLRNVDKISHTESLFGYSNLYDGLGIYLNTVLRQDQKGVLVSPISAFLNNGETMYNPFGSSAHRCFKKLRNLPIEQYLRIRIFYDKPLISVYYYDINSQQYELCLSIEGDLSYNGYFLISAGSGINTADHIFLKSFKLYDPKIQQSNEHFQEARKQKIDHENIEEQLGEQAKDILENQSNQDIKQQNRVNLTELYEKIPQEHLALQQTFQRVVEMRDQSQEAFFTQFQQFPDTSTFEGLFSRIKELQIVLMGISWDIDKQRKTISSFERLAKQKNMGKGGKQEGQAQNNGGSEQDCNKVEVENLSTKNFKDNLSNVEPKLLALKALMDELNALTSTITSKVKVSQNTPERYVSGGNLKNYENQQQKVSIDLSEMERMFDEIDKQSGQGYRSFSTYLVNLGMIAVICFSGFVWFKLDSYENKYDKW